MRRWIPACAGMTDGEEGMDLMDEMDGRETWIPASAGMTVVSPAAMRIFNRFLHFAFGFGRNDQRVMEWYVRMWYESGR